ncbi:ranBP2-type zinc finger protein At1g67325-like isoform X4 [Telopea speciosissima]|uniref:ranBP2-type zinc finger protein At1g67325-like isoform X4 n=1 Tax=Telopea speciosissima TaxID=54955 RepID=UPI001CC3AC72|nr:ranBP2-type zinc finger protein At1g67325-like isoform X4 [Telopea speciosissima]
MSQVDNRNSSAAKRARTDGSRREDDWTCPSCGNVNFSFRTTCNMRNCTQSRPIDHNSKLAAKPVQAPQSYSSSAPYLGSGPPPSMYLAIPPYGSSLFNGPSLPPYDLPFSGASGYPYDYGSRLSSGSPYGPLHLSGPSPYPSGSMLGTGGMYSIPPLMDRYGLGLPMGHAPMAAKSEKNSKQKMPEGCWKCEKCNNINYPFRTKCNRQNCGAEKPSETNKSPAPTSEEDEQLSTVPVSTRTL